MKMYNPPHPGEIIKELWIEPLNISITQAANAMDLSRQTLSKIVNGKKGKVTPEIAIRLSIALGGSPESWMGHQVTYELWQTEQHRGQFYIKPLLRPDC